MDDRSTVSPAAVSTIERIQADQVIFTSVRSTTAEGYRIIAASAGVTPEERAEITRRAPSHGSLCEKDPQARALSVYPLAGGRCCIALSRYAGVEHTARGGYRVHTHMVVLNRRDYLAFDCNAVRVYAVLCEVVGNQPVVQPPPKLGQLSMPVPCANSAHEADAAWVNVFTHPDVHAAQPPLPSAEVLSISQGILVGEELIVTDAHNRFDLLEQVVESLPLAVRQTLAVSAGLKYSPSRRLRLCFVAGDQGELRKAIRGRKVRLITVNALHSPLPHPSTSTVWSRLQSRASFHARPTH